MSDGSKTNDTDNTSDEPEGRMARLRRRMREWQIQKQVARGLAFGVSSNAVSLLVFWVQTRY
jgi:hypothetical protein